jgi:protein SCO1/2
VAEVRRRRRALVAASTLALTLALTACSGGQPDQGAALSTQDVGTPWVVTDTQVTNTDGEDYTLTGSTDKPVTLVFFGYTNCPDICGMVMGNLASALTRLDEEQRKDVDVVFVTTDPARDTEEALRTYLDRYDPSFVGVTAEMPRILELGAAFHIPIEQGEELPSGGYDVMHGDQIFLVNSDDVIPMYWSRDTSPATFASDIATLLKADS